MRHSLRSSRTHTLKASHGLAAMAAVLMGAGSICLLTSTSASASTLGGVATISDPTGVNPMTSGGSTDQFSVTLPANASCTGDTATDGYHVFTYMVPQGTSVSSITFTSFPSTGFGLFHNNGVYYGPVNTAITTGQIIGLPNNFEWGPLVSVDGVALSTLLYSSGNTTGVWEAGIACANSSGVLTDNWNTELTFNASATDPTGFVWATASSTPPPTTTTTTTTAPGSTSSTTTTTPTGILGTTTTTTATGDPSTTTTTTVAGGTVSGTSTGTGSGGTGSSGTGSGGSPLPFTGAPLSKFLGAGLLAIGVALMLLGWANRRVRLARSNRSTPR